MFVVQAGVPVYVPEIEGEGAVGLVLSPSRSQSAQRCSRTRTAPKEATQLISLWPVKWQGMGRPYTVETRNSGLVTRDSGLGIPGLGTRGTWHSRLL